MTRNIRIALGLLSVLLGTVALVGVARAQRTDSDPDQSLNVVTTIAMVADVARQVGGDRVSVESIMGEGVDPHLYKATRADMAKMLRADAIFYNGLMLEGKMSDALIQVARRKPVFAVTQLVDEDQLLAPDEMEGHYDPHLWMDPLRWAMTVDVVRDGLIEVDPAGRTAYEAGAAAYRAKLEALHAYSEQALASVPEPARVLVTAHDAFNYLADRYDFEVMGIQGISTESEAGLADIQAIVSTLVQRDIPAVFVETTVADRNIKALIAGAKDQGHKVVIGGSLFSDAMGAPGTYEGTYLGMIDHNVTTIVRALGGTAPPQGYQGRLGASAPE